MVGSLDVRSDEAVREGGGRQATIGEDVVDAGAVVRRPSAGSRSPAREGVSLGRVEIPEHVNELRRRNIASVLPYDVFRSRLPAALANVPRYELRQPQPAAVAVKLLRQKGSCSENND